MNTRKLLIAGLVAGLTATALPILARPHGGDMGMGNMGSQSTMMSERGGMMRQLRALDLTDAQEDKIFGIQHNSKPAMRDHMRAMQKAREALSEMQQDGRYDKARVRQLADAQAKAMADMIVLRSDTEQQIRNVLTAEQRAKADEMRSERMKQRESRRGGRRGESRDDRHDES